MRHVSSSFIQFHQDPGWTALYSSLTVQPTERGNIYARMAFQRPAKCTKEGSQYASEVVTTCHNLEFYGSVAKENMFCSVYSNVKWNSKVHRSE